MKQFFAKSSNSLKIMKKLIFGLAFMGSFAFGSPEVNAQEVGGGGSGGFECKTEVIRCNWYNADTRTICHENGNGIS
jgi:hypothetical protein